MHAPEDDLRGHRRESSAFGTGVAVVKARSAQSGGDKFAGLAWEPDADGVPRLAGCIARFQCRRFEVYPGGDHRIILGQVLAFETVAGAPLLFVQGQYLDAAGLSVS